MLYYKHLISNINLLQNKNWKRFSYIMQKITHTFLALILAFSFTLANMTPILAAEDDGLDDAIELTEATEMSEIMESTETTEPAEAVKINIDDFSEDELTEAEPDEIPESTDDSLTDSLTGQMLLDVEGNGEVYYNVLPEDSEDGQGGKEYLADGKAAYSLLQRRALGINEENFAKLTIGEERNDENVCRFSSLGRRLKGRIVIRVQKHGEAYYIYPKNCRAYYTGTFDAAYQLMRKLSLGITKANLAHVRDNARQKAKRAFRHLVYAKAEELDISLEEAKTQIKDEVKSLHSCLKDARADKTSDVSLAQHKDAVRACVQNSDLPRINKARAKAIRNTIHELRQEFKGKRDRLKTRLKALHQRAQEARTNKDTAEDANTDGMTDTGSAAMTDQ